MTFLEVSYALAPPVGPDAVGGAEQVLSLVDAALARAGHRSLLVAPEGSVAAGALVPTPSHPPPWGPAARAAALRAHRSAIRRTLGSERVDVVHLHGIDFAALLPEGARTVATLHLPPGWYPPEALRSPAGEVSFVCVSESQARAVPAGVPVAAVLPNGVALDVHRPGGEKQDFALLLARICVEKGIAPALAAARAAGIRLLVGGQAFPYPEHVHYLEHEVRPLLDGERRLLGPLARAEKARLLAAARCLVVPSLAPETSSLVAMEALASGTPVVARRVGALPEIVEDGRTGFLVDRDEELGPAMREAARLSPATCRREAERRFSGEDAGRRWVSFLEAAAARRPCGRRVETVVGLPALEALRSKWSELCDRAAAATPFQRPEWLLPWCRAAGVTEPFAVALRSRGQLDALVPLVAYRDGERRRVTLLGSGVSDYQDAIVDAGRAPAADALLEAVLARLPGDADELLVEHLPGGSPLRGAGAEPDGACPVVGLDGATSVEEVAAPRLAANVRSARRRLARAGAAITTAAAGDLDRHLHALFALHAARWSARGQAGVLAAPALRRFHAEVARGMLARGLLRLHVLWVDGRAAAAWYGFLDHRRAFYYLGGFDPAQRAASPGAVAIAHALESAAAEGARELDFLRGREPYKYEWGARDRATWRAVVALRARAALGA